MLQETTNLAVFVSIVALAIGAVQLIGAQLAGATLFGTLTDQQGGALGRAKVVVKNEATDVAVQTNALDTIYSASTNLRNTFFTNNPTLKDFEPRVGFAWDPFRSGRTSVRGGFGVFDVLPGPYIVVLNNAPTAPFVGSVARVGPPNTPVPAPGAWPYAIPSLAVNAPPTARNWDYVEPTQTFNIQFPVELFNVLNRTNFGPPNANSLEINRRDSSLTDLRASRRHKRRRGGSSLR